MQDYKNKVFKLEGKVQHYDWGGTQYLPELLHMPNPKNRPFAEYWMGAHSQAPSQAIDSKGTRLSLDQWIASSPEMTMGPLVYHEFGRLPYLLKILDVKNMLSIQVHPNKSNAESAFASENRLRVPLDSPSRNYKDDNHKPELMVALGDFWLLHGFKPRKALQEMLGEIKEFNFLQDIFGEGNYKNLYQRIMYMEQSEVDRIMRPLLDRIQPAYFQGKLSKHTEDFWAARAATIFKDQGRIDRGIFSIYFFNLLSLNKGEAIFQDAGIPHAYLEGQNIEIMANSDNVLRAGLTSKHINVNELMKHILFEPTIPEIIHPEKRPDGWNVFPTPAADFELRLLSLERNESIKVNSDSLEIYFVLEGDLRVLEHGNLVLQRKKGEAFVSIYKSQFICEALSPSLLVQAGPGVGK